MFYHSFTFLKSIVVNKILVLYLSDNCLPGYFDRCSTTFWWVLDFNKGKNIPPVPRSCTCNTAQSLQGKWELEKESLWIWASLKSAENSYTGWASLEEDLGIKDRQRGVCPPGVRLTGPVRSLLPHAAQTPTLTNLSDASSGRRCLLWQRLVLPRLLQRV